MQRRHRVAHRRAWLLIAVVLPVLFVLALAVRPDLPVDEDAQQFRAQHMDGEG